MNRRTATAFGVAAVVALSARALAGQSVLTGTVRADSTGRPLAGVEVVVSGSDRRALTDNAGRYVLNMLPAGRRMVLFRSVGFRPVQEWVVLGEADTVWANPMLIPETVRLDPLVVTARPDAPRGIGVEAFEERRRLGFGKFLDSTDLRRNDHLPLVEMLGRLQGIGFARVPGEKNSIAAVSQRRFTPDGGVCYMSVIVD
ncbi:MAG TPA: carboxypeptidase regulatory-like domain-containing protein, partial [Gemmatimonadales bacterium]